jgi:Icc-related predicted phosphoesterase
MKVCCTSDWHGYLPWIPPCDVLVLAGDYEPNTNPLEALACYRAMAKHLRVQSIRLGIVMVAGNHDWLLYNDPQHVLKTMNLGRHLHYLKDFGCEIAGVRFWGSPWTTPFFDWAFMKPEEELRVLYEQHAPDAVDVLVTHGPPDGILDRNGMSAKCGSPALAAYLRRAKPQLHAFGHIHEMGGKSAGIMVGDDGQYVACCNVSYVNPRYIPAHPPQVFDVRAPLIVSGERGLRLQR